MAAFTAQGDGILAFAWPSGLAVGRKYAVTVERTDAGDDMEAMVSTDDEMPVTESRFGLNIDEGTPLTDGEEYTFEFAMLDAEGQPVTVTKTARWSAG